MAAAKRLDYEGALRWRASTHNISATVPAGSILLTGMVAEAVVLVDAFRALIDIWSASEEDELLQACAEAMTALSDAVDTALKTN